MSKLGKLFLSLAKESFVQYLGSSTYTTDLKRRKSLGKAETFENVYEDYCPHGLYTDDMKNFVEGLDELIGMDAFVKYEEESVEEFEEWIKAYFNEEFYPMPE
jgi:hypothetical protein